MSQTPQRCSACPARASHLPFSLKVLSGGYLFTPTLVFRVPLAANPATAAVPPCLPAPMRPSLLSAAAMCAAWVLLVMLLAAAPAAARSRRLQAEASAKAEATAGEPAVWVAQASSCYNPAVAQSCCTGFH